MAGFEEFRKMILVGKRRDGNEWLNIVLATCILSVPSKEVFGKTPGTRLGFFRKAFEKWSGFMFSLT